MSTLKLAGKVAVVTGASKGIGASIAKDFAAEGASVVVNYSSSRANADQLVAGIVAAGGKAIAVQADLSKPSEVASLFAETKRVFGHVDILVNNAGIYSFAPLEAIDIEHFRSQFDLNVLGLILATKEAVALFPEGGGNVINISSVVAQKGFPGAAVYSGTKGAVDAITRSLAVELGPKGIRVNAINPGMVETEGVKAAPEIGEMKAQVESVTPLGRIGQPGDISSLAVFLASGGSSWITGETFVVAGGFR